ncbi:Transposase type 1 [Octopus vulgaris]|uniref:Transposase type 1 n=1 Tax=Octopus vulgaris TaxID=6645 RepID=A0AA36BK96_OCTVU|nr:Transposase type 1 [Octopus vulgaris]
MNMTKKDLRLLFLHEFKLGHNAFQTAANSNRAWGEGSTSDHTVPTPVQKFRSSDDSLEYEEETKGRKKRKPYTRYQTMVLENEFLNSSYITRQKRWEISLHSRVQREVRVATGSEEFKVTDTFAHN